MKQTNPFHSQETTSNARLPITSVFGEKSFVAASVSSQKMYVYAEVELEMRREAERSSL